MQTSPHIKRYASLGTLRDAVCLLFCWWCLILNAVAGPPPVITTQPQNQTVQVGGAATFAVAATSGTTLTYQWYFQSNPIPGATNSICSRTNAQLTHAGVYYAEVSNADGTVNSTNAILTVNEAPSLSGANDLTAISQNEVNNSGTLVSDLIAGKQTDPDPGALQGIAVVAVNNANGTWEYSTDGGSDWSPFGNPTENAARLLAAEANSRVRFAPNANFVGTVAGGLTFRAWDQTIGSHGGTLAITVTSNTVLDQFTTVSYLNDDGTQFWSTRWIETEAGAIGPASGYFKISGSQDQLQLAANHTGDNIYREVNLSGATFATLSYWYDSTKFGQSVALQMEVSSDAGASYTHLKTYSWPGARGTENFDITSYISANTRIRFHVSTGHSVNNDFKTDDVQVAFLFPGGGPTAFSTNTASASLTVMLAADITTTMSGPSTVSAGADYSYAVSVLNQGPSTANNVQVSQALPAGATFVSASSGGSYNAGVVTWSLAELASGVAANLTVTVTAPASGTLSSLVSSTALTSDPNAANNDGTAAEAQVVTTVTPQADIVTTLSGPSAVSAGANYSYTVSVFNQGPSVANSVQVSQALPLGATFVSASNGGAYNGGEVTWSLAGLSSGVAANLTVTVTAPANGTMTSSVSSTALTSDPNAANNDGSAATAQMVTTVTPQADIATTMAGPSAVSAGADFSYAVSVLNQGPSAANSVQVSQTLPAGATFVSASNGGAYNGGEVTWSLAGLASGVVANLTVTVTAPPSGTMTSSVSSTALTSDPNAANNDGSAATAQVVTTVTPQADIATTMAGPSAVSAGADFSYAVSILNQGPSAANSVQVSQTLPAGATFVSASNGGAYHGGEVTWSLAGLASGVAANLTVTVTAPPNGTLTSSVLSSALTSDPNAANNNGSAAAAQVVTTVTPQADIATTVTGPTIAITNTAFSYTVTVANLSTSAATSLSVIDTLPVGVSFVAASAGGTHNAGVVTWSLASLSGGMETNLTVSVVAPAVGSLTNTAASSAVGGDPDMSNNNGSATAARVVTEVHPFLALTGQWLPSGGFQVEFYTYPDTTLSILASSNLTDWATLITTNSGSGHVVFIDQDAVGYPQRFYRSLQAN